MASSIVGLDIGHGVIRGAEIADPTKPRPTLLRYESIGLAPGAIQRGEIVDQGLVVAALKQLWSNGGFKSKKVVLGMGNQRVLVRDVSLPRMPLTQMRESLPFQVQELLPVPVADAMLDFFPVSAGTGETGEVINGLLVAAVKAPVLKNVEAVQAAGLDPVEVDLIPFALTRSLLSGAEKAGLVALIHIGAVTTSIVVAQDGIPQFVRIVQYGGEDVTKALMTKLSVTEDQADQIKRGLGLATQGVTEQWKPAVDTVFAASRDLLDTVRNTLSFYLNTHAGAVFQRALISGGGAQLPGLPQALAEATRLAVGVADARSVLTVSPRANEKLAVDPSGFAVAAGLAMGSKS
jgi:type IV pilus assembly protein PilM